MRLVAKTALVIGAILLACSIHRMYVQNNGRLGQSSTAEMRAFNEWATKHRRQYLTPEEQSYRSKIFLNNLNNIKRHDAESTGYTVGVNQFTDLSAEEFAAKMVTSYSRESLLKIKSAKVRHNKPETSSLGQVPVIDWRQYLQQQSISTSSMCNSNYAWIAAVNMNANYYLSHNVPTHYGLSPQTYVDCSGNFGNNGCNGGNTINCYEYSKFWGVDTMQNYPYWDQQKACTASTGFFKNSDTYKVTQLSNTELYNSLKAKNVITVLIDITGGQFYTGGVFTGPCSTTVNHAVLLVGAGVDTATQTPYWNVMNTWGSTWGENGFMRIARFTIDGNPQYSSCGLNMYAHYPTFSS